MRQVGTLTNGSDAERFTSFLLTQGVTAHAEDESDGWAIWVRDEDQFDKAREEFEQFRINPGAARYKGVKQLAESLRRDEVERRKQIRKNIVIMGGRWKTGTARKAPLVFTLIALSVLATIWTDFGKNRNFEQLRFCSLAHLAGVQPGSDSFENIFVDIRRGQLWRLITPIFVHGTWLHIIFNMYWTYVFGTLIEDRKGTLKLGLMVLAIALISNVAQATIENPNFAGMSGVGFGLFGYAWMKTLYDPGAQIQISRGTIILFLVWFFLCLSNFMPVANTAHGAGLVVGVVIGYAPVLARTLKGH